MKRELGNKEKIIRNKLDEIKCRWIHGVGNLGKERGQESKPISEVIAVYFSKLSKDINPEISTIPEN